MININNKKWSDLTIVDIQCLLDSNDNENFFIEFKSDKVQNKKILEEISAFANTYGGYIIIGVEDDKTVSGCQTWNEQRIHTLIHDGITPIPSFDVKMFIHQNGEILVLKIDEGILPPYITSGGKIYERISSGSFPINDSSKLTQLYYKNREHLEKIKNKIYFENVISKLPNNLCAYLDLGFSLNTYDKLETQNKVLNPNFDKIVEILKESKNEYSISKLGYSLLISVGKSESNFNGKVVLPDSGLHNFIEIMSNGSVKCRIILYSNNCEEVNIAALMLIQTLFKKIYNVIMGKNFSQQFISAYKYEKLNVFKQFCPILLGSDSEPDEYDKKFKQYFEEHKRKYGNNLILTSNRIPKNDFITIDKKYFNDFNIDFNTNNIFRELFYSQHILLGYIDEFPKD